MANRGVDIGATPVNLVDALSLVSGQRYSGQILQRSRLYIGDFEEPPVPPGDNDDAFAINVREGTAFQIPSIPATGAVYAWTDEGQSNRIVVNEAE